MFDGLKNCLVDPVVGQDCKDYMEGYLSLVCDPSMNLLVLSELMEGIMILHKHKSLQQNFPTLSVRLSRAMMDALNTVHRKSNLKQDL